MRIEGVGQVNHYLPLHRIHWHGLANGPVPTANLSTVIGHCLGVIVVDPAQPATPQNQGILVQVGQKIRHRRGRWCDQSPKCLRVALPSRLLLKELMALVPQLSPKIRVWVFSKGAGHADRRFLPA